MITLERLVSKARQGRNLGEIPPNLSLLSFDPGLTTGYALFQGINLRTHGQLVTPDLQSGTHEYTQVISTFKPDIVITEDYRIYSWKLKQHEWSSLVTPKLVGTIEVLSAQKGIPVIKQMAHRAKAFCTDDKLEAWNLYVKGQKHARDAIRHALFYLAFGKLPKELLHETTNIRTTDQQEEGQEG